MISVLGSINLDLISYCKKLPQVGQTIAGSNFITGAGGKGANVALAAIKAGAEVKLIGMVGNDIFAEQALSLLKKEKADLSAIKIVNCSTGVANIFVSENGDNMIIVVSGANAKLDSKIAKQAIAQMNAGDIILLNQEIPKDTVLTALKVAKKAKIKTIFNISPFSSSTKELAPLADIVIANANEFDELMGEKIIFEKLPKYLMQYAKDNNQTIIVTLGEKGAICANSNDIFTIKAPKVKPIDSVGAGDSFFGYFAAEIDRGKSLKQAVKKAIIAGSLATLKRGAQPSIPYKEQVENFIFD